MPTMYHDVAYKANEKLTAGASPPKHILYIEKRDVCFKCLDLKRCLDKLSKSTNFCVLLYCQK